MSASKGVASLLTALLGSVLALAGVIAFRRGGTATFHPELIALAVLVLATVAVYIAKADFRLGSIVLLGPGLVVAGGGIAGVGSYRLGSGDRGAREGALRRRAPLALLFAGAGMWIFTGQRYFPELAPLLYSIVLASLGVGLWPDRIPVTRLRPTTVGLGLVLYGALGLCARLIHENGFLLLEMWPLALLLVLLISRQKLDLPPLNPPLIGEEGRAKASVLLFGTRATSTMLAAALALTSAALVLLILKVAGADPPDSLRLGGLHDPEFLAASLAAGVALVAGIALAVDASAASRPPRIAPCLTRFPSQTSA